MTILHIRGNALRIAAMAPEKKEIYLIWLDSGGLN